ncbi:MAG: UDP-4-amino-4,6-dideoxy-N-acetyl-beta-L-altrosamine transaminase, partial [Nitrospinota bacterium]
MLPYGRHVVDENDIRAVTDVLKGDWLTTGPMVEEYEKEIGGKTGAGHAVSFSSGTAALHAAAFAAGISDGDEVITSPITFAATSNCILYMGGKPLFADIDADSCNVDPAHMEELITPKTRALIPVDYAGQPANYDEINSIAEKYGLTVIEDAAHALGAEYKKRPVGSIADMTVFSTHPVKNITTGEGGIVTTNDKKLADRLRSFRSHGISTDARQRLQQGTWFYEMNELGFNYRLPDILCALGKSQLEKLDKFIRRRREIAGRYEESFKEIPEVEPLRRLKETESAWHLYVVRFDLERLRVGRDVIFDALRAEGIGVNVHYIPVYMHPYYQRLGYKKGLCPKAEEQYEKLITIPLWPGLTDKDVD